MDCPLISVIIPVYKVEKYLEKCIESVASQTFNNLEIILVDDGSPDGCPEICDVWCHKDTRVRVVHKQNGGLSSARNAGLDIAKGTFISFVDSDDYLDLKMLESLLAEMKDPDVGIVESGYREISQKGTLDYVLPYKRRSSEDAISHLLLCDGKVKSLAWNKLYRREVVQDLRFDETVLFGEDTFFNYQAIKNAKVLLQIPYIGYYYVRRENSLIGNCFRPVMMHSLAAAQSMALEAAADFPELWDRAHCHVALTAYHLMSSLLILPDAKAHFPEEYRILLSTLKESTPPVIQKYSSKWQYLLYLLCRDATDFYCWLSPRWKTLKAWIARMASRRK